MIAAAPLSFAALVLLTAAVAWLALRWAYKSRLDIKADEIAILQRQCDELRQRAVVQIDNNKGSSGIKIEEHSGSVLQPTYSRINPLKSYFSHEHIRIVDLIYDKLYVVENKVFEDCVLYGPAFVSFTVPSRLTGQVEHFKIHDCQFSGPKDELFFEIDYVRRFPGLIGLIGCTFVRCRFDGVCIIADKVIKTKLLESMGAADPSAS